LINPSNVIEEMKDRLAFIKPLSRHYSKLIFSRIFSILWRYIRTWRKR